MIALRPSLIAICLCTTVSVNAGTIIEGHDEIGGTHTIFIAGKKVKIEADDKSYMLIDLEKKTYLAIDPNERSVVDLSDMYKPASKGTSSAKSASPLKIKTEKLGKGPKLAGFETTRFKVSVNGTVCSEEFLSEQAAKLPDMATFFATVVALSNPGMEDAMPVDAGSQADGTLCMRADEQLNSQLYAKHGIPLKVLSSAGKLIHEIVNIRGKEKIDAAMFDVPKEFTRVTMQEMEKALSAAMGEIRSAPPACHPSFADSNHGKESADVVPESAPSMEAAPAAVDAK